jgi:hypothetical protein
LIKYLKIRNYKNVIGNGAQRGEESKADFRTGFFTPLRMTNQYFSAFWDSLSFFSSSSIVNYQLSIINCQLSIKNLVSTKNISPFCTAFAPLLYRFCTGFVPILHRFCTNIVPTSNHLSYLLSIIYPNQFHSRINFSFFILHFSFKSNDYIIDKTTIYSLREKCDDLIFFL